MTTSRSNPNRPNATRSNASRLNGGPVNNRNLAPVRRPPSFTEVVQDKVDKFLNSIGNVLNDITALEVNTMVVSEITGHKFNPEDAYVAIYEIPENVNDPYFDAHRVPTTIRTRYTDLRKKLQDAYDEYLNGIQESEPPPGPELPDPRSSLDEAALIRLLQNNQFLRNLRKLRELRHVLEGPQAAAENIVDIISAQTVIQLDGDILNRFDRRLLTDTHKEFLLQVHKQAVLSGETQWRSLLKFMVDLVEEVATRRRGPDSSISLLPDGRNSDS